MNEEDEDDDDGKDFKSVSAVELGLNRIIIGRTVFLKNSSKTFGTFIASLPPFKLSPQTSRNSSSRIINKHYLYYDSFVPRHTTQTTSLLAKKEDNKIKNKRINLDNSYNMSTPPEETLPPTDAAATSSNPTEEEGEEEEPSRQEMYRRAMEADADEPLFVMMSQPTTALVVLSKQMLFKPDEDIIHVMVQTKEDLAKCLEEEGSLDIPVADGSLETIHLVVRAVDVDRMFDETAFTHWNRLMQPGGNLDVHIVSDGAQVADDDVAMITMALLQAEFKLTSSLAVVEGADGDRLVSGLKAGGNDGVIEEEDEDGSDEEDDKEKCDNNAKTEESASS